MRKVKNTSKSERKYDDAKTTAQIFPKKKKKKEKEKRKGRREGGREEGKMDSEFFKNRPENCVLYPLIFLKPTLLTSTSLSK